MDSQIEQHATTTEFDRATAVEQVGDGRYTGDVQDGWGAPPGPNGGYLAAIVARAMQDHLAPAGERQLRSLTAHYLRPARPGPVDLIVETVRAGRRFSPPPTAAASPWPAAPASQRTGRRPRSST